MLTPLLSCLLDDRLVFCWISRCPGELGIAIMARWQEYNLLFDMEALPLLCLHMCILLPRDFMEITARHWAEWTSSRSLACVSRQHCAATVATNWVFLKLRGAKHNRAESLHPAGPIHASETVPQQRHLENTFEYLYSFLIFEFDYHISQVFSR